MSEMQALVQERFGSPREVLQLRTLPTPTPGADSVLVRVHAASLNPLDWHSITGTPYLTRIQAGWRTPKQATPGADVAGTVVAIGADVTRFAIGDDVFGTGPGSLAEFVVCREVRLSHKPSTVGFAEAAAVPVAAVSALQALRKADVRAGSRVLINGASGGVGTFAVQIARHLGAHVTGVCSGRNVDLVRSLGADAVIDYESTDFTADEAAYDVLIDNVGNRTLGECRRVLQPKGAYVVIGGPKKGKVLGPMKRLAAAKIAFAPHSQRAIPFLANINEADSETLRGMLASGAITSVIDRTYALAEFADAFDHLASGHARGKIIVTP